MSVVSRLSVLKHLAVMAAAVAFASCSPRIYGISVEMRRPSSSGLDLTGKSVAIVYPCSILSLQENKLMAGIASSLADRLDAAYPESDSTALYSLRYSEDYNRNVCLDSLANLTLKTDADMLFFFCRSGSFGNGYNEGYFTVPLYCYDALSGKNRPMRAFTIAGDAGSDAEASGRTVGGRASEAFTPNWSVEDFCIWYTGDSEWSAALDDALGFRWDSAVKKWMSILENTSGNYDRSCLEYNIGLGCFMMGDNSLARQWLEQSNAEYQSELTTALISRVGAE